MAKPEPFRSLGFYAIAWIEHFLVHGPGDVQGQPIDLDDEFATFILKGYEVDGRGSRKVRRAFLSRSKGRSKSGLAAMIECFEALGECRFDHWAEPGEVSDWGYQYDAGEPVGRPLTYVEILNVATEESQAGNTYDAVYYMLNAETCSPELLAKFGKLDVGLTRINLPNRRGFIEPVTASNESKDGGKSTFIVADETHLWIPPVNGKFKLGKMHQTMVRNLLKRKVASGWMLETSTMYADGEGSVAEGTHSYAKAMAASGRKDGKLLFDHRQASMEWDLSKRSERIKALREAYGPAAAWMDLQAIADYWDDPQASEADFRRFWLNQPVPLVEAPQLVMPNWPNCRTSRELPSPECLAVAHDIDRVWISVAAASGGERPHVGAVTSKTSGEVLHVRASTHRGHALAEVARICRERKIPVVVDAKDAPLIEDLQALDDPPDIIPASLDDYVQGCADLFDAVEAKQAEHGGDAPLDDAVKAAGWSGGERRKWAPVTGEVSMLKAATLAFWGSMHDTGPVALTGSLMA